MNRTGLTLSFFILTAVIFQGSLGWAASPTTPSALTLRDCYDLALKRSETIAIQKEKIAEAEGRFTQSFSTILPRVSYSASDKWQDGTGGSSFTLREVPETKFVFSQPLFSGFKEFAAMAASRAEQRQRKDEKSHAEQLLFLDVADAFYLLLQQQKDLEELTAIQTILTERIEELKKRESLGRSRLSEVVSAEAQLNRIEAEREDARSQEAIARQLLEFLTGLEPIPALTDAEATEPISPSLDDYLSKVDRRPNLQAAQEASLVAQKEVAIAKSGFWPDVDVEGNSYTKRRGAAEGVDWDILLKVTTPLFQGGETSGKVKEAQALANQAKLQFEKTQRDALRDIKEAYIKAQSAVAKCEALAKTLESAEKNYELQQKDYQRSLVSNLDVLQALQGLQDAKRDFLQVEYEAKRLYWHLKVAAGEDLP